MKYVKEILAFILINVFLFTKGHDKQCHLSIYFHNPSQKLFSGIIKWLASRKFTIVSLSEFELLLKKGDLPSKLALLTFDDGWRDNLKLIPIIQKFNVPVAIFITTEAILQGNYWWEYAFIDERGKNEGLKNVKEFKKLPFEVFTKKVNLIKRKHSIPRSALTLDELKQLSKNPLVTIGSHTVTHPILVKCDCLRQEVELEESKSTLETWLQRDIEFFAYPNGDFNSTTIDIARKTGYKLCFTTIQSKMDLATFNPYLIPRFCVNDKGGFYENVAKISGIWNYVFKK